jgi:hypothetical protein
MIVSPEFSRLTGFTPGDNQPIIDKRLATTTMAVANRQTVVIGGLRERRDVGDFRGIPYLMDVRYVGNLFRYRKTDVRESELVLFISPEIISVCDPVVCRDARIIDTVGCRLNQIPLAEGCPPCGPPPAGYAPPPYHPCYCEVKRLPPIGEAAVQVEVATKPEDAAPAEAKSADDVAADVVAANGATQPGDLFGAPPVEGNIVPGPQPPSQVGGYIEVGGRAGALRR